MSGMKAAVRCQAIDMAGLAAQEKHGKREDAISQKRRIRDASPLVAGGLNLRELYDEHVTGARVNSAAKKKVLHFIVRFPPDLLDGPQVGRFGGSRIDRQKQMLRQAVRFIEETHGGDAVFAARVDRDEEGETIVDVFASPKYEKRTKRTKPDEPGVLWVSATKFGKELAEKHGDEIRRRHPKNKGKLTGPRHVGIALQSEFAEFFERENGVKLDRKVEKSDPRSDRLEKEAHDRIEAERAALDEEKAEFRDASRADIERLKRAWGKVQEGQADVERAKRNLDKYEAHLDDREAEVSGLMRRIERVVGAVAKIFGLPLPGDIAESVEELERGVKNYRNGILRAPDDPFSAATREEPGDDAGPGLG